MSLHYANVTEMLLDITAQLLLFRGPRGSEAELLLGLPLPLSEGAELIQTAPWPLKDSCA